MHAVGHALHSLFTLMAFMGHMRHCFHVLVLMAGLALFAFNIHAVHLFMAFCRVMGHFPGMHGTRLIRFHHIGGKCFRLVELFIAFKPVGPGQLRIKRKFRLRIYRRIPR